MLYFPYAGFRFTNSSSGDNASVLVKGNAEINCLTVCLRFKATQLENGIGTLLSFVNNDSPFVVQLHVKRTVRIRMKNHSRLVIFGYVSFS